MQITLSDIQWVERQNELPRRLVYELDAEAQRVWKDRLVNDMRGNRFEFRKLLKDVFHVQAEREHGYDIIRCRFDIKGA